MTETLPRKYTRLVAAASGSLIKELLRLGPKQAKFDLTDAVRPPFGRLFECVVRLLTR
jgi:hypothetical protein